MKIRSLGIWLRTLRHLRPRQALAQVRHFGAGPVRPVRLAEAAPTLRVDSLSVPFLPAPAHAHFDAWRRFRLVNREVEFRDAIDWDHRGEGPLWSYHLHQFDWLRRPGLGAEARSAVMLDWIERHPSGVGWDPYPLALRILSWGRLLLQPGALALDGSSREPSARQRILHSLAEQVETLARHPEVRLQANHLLCNWLGVVFGGLLLDGPHSRRWLDHAEALRSEIEEQVGQDGAHYERSPMYHALLLEQLLDLLNLLRAVAQVAPASLLATTESAVARMLGALEVFTHPDGEIALFSDSAFGIAHSPRFLATYASALGVEPRRPGSPGWLPDVGYGRLSAGPFSLLASVAGPLPAYQPGHAHCDALAFELCVEGERVVTDTGVTEYLPGPLRDAARGTRSHATAWVGGSEQAEIWSAHRVGGRPRVEFLGGEPARSLEARCEGWASSGSWHRRRFEVETGSVHIHDSLEGSPRPLELRLPLAPGLEPRIVPAGGATGSGAGARAQIRLASGRELRIELPSGEQAGLTWRVERLPYFPEFGRSLERACLVGSGETFRRGSWRFELLSRR